MAPCLQEAALDLEAFCCQYQLLFQPPLSEAVDRPNLLRPLLNQVQKVGLTAELPRAACHKKQLTVRAACCSRRTPKAQIQQPRSPFLLDFVLQALLDCVAQAVRWKDSFARLEQDMHQFAAGLPGMDRSKAELHRTGDFSPAHWQVVQQLVGASCSLLAGQLLLS